MSRTAATGHSPNPTSLGSPPKTLRNRDIDEAPRGRRRSEATTARGAREVEDTRAMRVTLGGW